MVILKIDRALYEVNDETRIYKYCGRNLDWKNLSKEENIKNKQHLDGYTRLFPNGREKTFRFKTKI